MVRMLVAMDSERPARTSDGGRIREAAIRAKTWFLVAISVTFPLFLFARERRLAAGEPAATEPAPTLADKLGLGLMTAGTVALCLWCTLR